MATQIEIKSIARPEWKRIEDRSFCWTEVEKAEFQGVAALMHLIRVRAPLRVTSCGGKRITIADDGCWWLQMAPKDCHWWMTAMLDPSGEAVQYYFDITRQNRINGGESCFEDLMLDVILTPDEPPALLDEDELEAAMTLGNITKAERDLAKAEAKAIMQGLQSRKQELFAFCDTLFETLRPKIK